MNKKINFIIFVIIIFPIILSACQFNGGITDNGEYKITNINIYRDTPVWELALAVKKQRIKTIEKIAKENPELLDYQEPTYDTTLLLWAIGTERYKAAESLLMNGADPNIASTIRGETPLFVAAGYSWVDNNAKKDAKYVKLLLSYGADPNINYTKEDSIIELGTSPLMRSIRSGIDKTKALVEAGADINHKTQSGTTVAIIALSAGGPNATLEGTEYAHYLIVEKKTQVIEPYYRRKVYGNEDPNEEFFPVDILRNWVYDLDSERHKIKMEIVEEFARQGINYWDTEINPSTLEQIQKLYPDTWKEYIKKY